MDFEAKHLAYLVSVFLLSVTICLCELVRQARKDRISAPIRARRKTILLFVM